MAKMTRAEVKLFCVSSVALASLDSDGQSSFALSPTDTTESGLASLSPRFGRACQSRNLHFFLLLFGKYIRSDMAEEKRIPAWKRLGLKLKNEPAKDAKRQLEADDDVDEASVKRRRTEDAQSKP